MCNLVVADLPMCVYIQVTKPKDHKSVLLLFFLNACSLNLITCLLLQPQPQKFLDNNKVVISTQTMIFVQTYPSYFCAHTKPILNHPIIKQNYFSSVKHHSVERHRQRMSSCPYGRQIRKRNLSPPVAYDSGVVGISLLQ